MENHPNWRSHSIIFQRGGSTWLKTTKQLCQDLTPARVSLFLGPPCCFFTVPNYRCIKLSPNYIAVYSSTYIYILYIYIYVALMYEIHCPPGSKWWYSDVIWYPQAQLSRLSAPQRTQKNIRIQQNNQKVSWPCKIEDWNADWRLISFWKYIWLLFDDYIYTSTTCWL